MNGFRTVPNADLTVGEDNKQSWNEPSNRRRGFHQGHARWRRVLMIRFRRTFFLRDEPDATITAAMATTGLKDHPAFSELVVARDDRILYSSHADDFGFDLPHSIQSVTKLHAHLILDELIADGSVDPVLAD